MPAPNEVPAAAGQPAAPAAPAAPAQEPNNGTMSRDMLNSNKAHQGFQSARAKLKERVKKEDENEATTQAATAEGAIQGDALFDNFDLDEFIANNELEAQRFEADIDRSNELEKIRKEGLDDAGKTKLEEIKQRVKERKEAAEKGDDVSGTPNQDPAAPPPQTAVVPPVGQPSAAGGTVVPPVTPPEGQPATPLAETPPVTLPVTPPVTPPVVETPPVVAPVTSADITKAVEETVSKQLEPLRKQVEEGQKENDTLKEALVKAEETTKDVISQRDKLKQQTNFNRFSAAAATAGIAKDLHQFAHQEAQKIVDEANKSGDVAGQMTFEEIFEKMKTTSPSFFNKSSTTEEIQVIPGATGTGSSAGGTTGSQVATKKEKASTFEEAKLNLRARSREMG